MRRNHKLKNTVPGMGAMFAAGRMLYCEYYMTVFAYNALIIFADNLHGVRDRIAASDDVSYLGAGSGIPPNHDGYISMTVDSDFGAMVTRSTREQLFAIRRMMKDHDVDVQLYNLFTGGILRYRGSRGGRRLTSKVRARTIVYDESSVGVYAIQPVVSQHIPRYNQLWHPSTTRCKCLTYIQLDVHKQKHKQCTTVSSNKSDGQSPPSLYTLNAGNITKPNAIQQLRSEISLISPGVVMITETWFTGRHTDDQFLLAGYVLFRKDRNQLKGDGRMRKGGGVSIYVKTRYGARVFTPTADVDQNLEILWICFQSQDKLCYVGAVYHPPKPIYSDIQLMKTLESTINEITSSNNDVLILLAGDFNQLPDKNVESLGLIRIRTAPTSGKNCLDRLYVSEPVYSDTVVMSSIVKSDDKAIFAHNGQQSTNNNKTKKQVSFRKSTPAQNARYLEYLSRPK